MSDIEMKLKHLIVEKFDVQESEVTNDTYIPAFVI